MTTRPMSYREIQHTIKNEDLRNMVHALREEVYQLHAYRHHSDMISRGKTPDEITVDADGGPVTVRVYGLTPSDRRTGIVVEFDHQVWWIHDFFLYLAQGTQDAWKGALRKRLVNISLLIRAHLGEAALGDPTTGDWL